MGMVRAPSGSMARSPMAIVFLDFFPDLSLDVLITTSCQTTKYEIRISKLETNPKR
jgi:hypothetical protein